MKAKKMFPMLLYGMQLQWIPVTLHTTLIIFATYKQPFNIRAKIVSDEAIVIVKEDLL